MHCSSSFSGHCQLQLYQNEANHCFVHLIHSSAAGGLFIQYFRQTKKCAGLYFNERAALFGPSVCGKWLMAKDTTRHHLSWYCKTNQCFFTQMQELAALAFVCGDGFTPRICLPSFIMKNKQTEAQKRTTNSSINILGNPQVFLCLVFISWENYFSLFYSLC